MTASTAWRTLITATSMHPSRHHRPSRARPSFLSRDVAAIVPVDVALGLSATWAGVGRDAREHLAVERLYDQAARGWRRLRGLALSTRLLRSLALARDVLDCRTSARLTGDIMANPPSQASPPRAEEESRRAPSWAAPRPVRERWSGVRGDRPRPTWPCRPAGPRWPSWARPPTAPRRGRARSPTATARRRASPWASPTGRSTGRRRNPAPATASRRRCPTATAVPASRRSRRTCSTPLSRSRRARRWHASRCPRRPTRATSTSSP